MLAAVDVTQDVSTHFKRAQHYRGAVKEPTVVPGWCEAPATAACPGMGVLVQVCKVGHVALEELRRH
eukprot:1887504-Lingulodinium_polyedra.AAC.1